MVARVKPIPTADLAQFPTLQQWMREVANLLYSTSGAIPVTSGGLGLLTVAQGDLIYGASSSAYSALAKSGTASYLDNSAASNNPAWKAKAALTKADDTNVTLTLGGTPTTALLAATSLTLGWTGQLAETRGGTNQSTYAQGDILYASASNTLAKLAKSSTTTHYLSNTGASNSPAWSQVNLADGVTGTLPIGSGGTNLTTYAQGDVVYASAANVLGKLAIGTVGKVLQSTGTLPEWGAVIASGVYSPAGTADVNLDATLALSQAQYMRVGSVVTVSGRFTANPTLAATVTSFELSLPIASNIGAIEDAAGTAVCGNIAGQSAEILGSVANNTAVITWRSGDVTEQSWAYTFTYRII